MTVESFFQKFDLLLELPDAVKKTRALILEMATQGRLVPQVPNEGEGATFLEAIRVARAGGGPYPASPSDNKCFGPSAIPSSWTWACLGEVTTIVRGVTFPGSAKSNVQRDNDVACLRTASVQAEIKWDDLIYISPNYVTRDDQWVAMNDVIISMANSYELVGKVAVVRYIPQKAAFGGFLAAIRPILIDPYFLHYVLRSPRMQSAFRNSSSQTTNIANISLGRMRPLPFPLPPFAEQKRIVAKVDELMALCDQLEAEQKGREVKCAALARAALARFTEDPNPANLELLFHSSFEIAPADLRKTIFALAVRGTLVPQDSKDDSAQILITNSKKERRKLIEAGNLKKTRSFEFMARADNPGLLPDGWAYCCVDEISLKVTDGEHATPQREDVGQYLLSARNIRDGFIDLSNVDYVGSAEFDRIRKRCNPDAGDILVSCSGSIGRVAVVDADNKYVMVRSAALIKPSRANVDSAYLSIALRSPDLQKQMQLAARQSAQANLFLEPIRKLVIPLPPYGEQGRIAVKVDQLLSMVDNLEDQQFIARSLATDLLDAVVRDLGSLPPSHQVEEREAIDLLAYPEFIRAVLAAEIVDHQHEHPTFGQTKLQKVLYLAEYIGEISEIGSMPRRFARGPHDPELMKQVEQVMHDERWFAVEHRSTGVGFTYRRLSKAGAHRSDFARLWPEKLSRIRSLIDEMKSWETERCERFATVYAAWNDLLIWGEHPTEKAILREVLERWHSDKVNIPRDRWLATIDWMRKRQYIPVGFGRSTKEASLPEV